MKVLKLPLGRRLALDFRRWTDLRRYAHINASYCRYFDVQRRWRCGGIGGSITATRTEDDFGGTLNGKPADSCPQILEFHPIRGGGRLRDQGGLLCVGGEKVAELSEEWGVDDAVE